MAESVMDCDLYVRGTLRANVNKPSTATVGDLQADANNPLAPNKTIRHESANVELAEEATAIVAITRWLHIFRAAGQILGFEAAIAVAADDVSRTVTIDLQKSTGGGAFATVLTGTIGFTNASTIRVPVAATISTPDCVDGDVFRAVVTVAGGAGNQAKGLLLTLTYSERM